MLADVTLAGGRPYAERAEEDRAGTTAGRSLHDATSRRAARALRLEGRSRMAAATNAAEPAQPAARRRAARPGAGPARPAAARGLHRGRDAEAFALIRAAAMRTLGSAISTSAHGRLGAAARPLVAEMETGEGKTFSATLPACTAALAGIRCTSSRSTTTWPSATPRRWGRCTPSSGLGVGRGAPGHGARQRRQAAMRCDVVYAPTRSSPSTTCATAIALGGERSGLHHRAGSAGGQGAGEHRAARPALRHRRRGRQRARRRGAHPADPVGQPATWATRRPRTRAALELAARLAEGEHYAIEPLEPRVIRLTDDGRAAARRLSRKPATALDVRAARGPARAGAQRAAPVPARPALRGDGRQGADRRRIHRPRDARPLLGARPAPDDRGEGRRATPTPRRETLARMTYQRLFRRYVHLAGMTGTAAEVAARSGPSTDWRSRGCRCTGPRAASTWAGGVRHAGEKWQRVADSAGARPAQPAAGADRHALGGGLRADQRGAARARPGARVLNAKQDAGEAEVVAEAGERPHHGGHQHGRARHRHPAGRRGGRTRRPARDPDRVPRLAPGRPPAGRPLRPPGRPRQLRGHRLAGRRTVRTVRAAHAPAARRPAGRRAYRHWPSRAAPMGAAFHRTPPGRHPPGQPETGPPAAPRAGLHRERE